MARLLRYPVGACNGSGMNLFVYGTLLIPKIWEAVTLENTFDSQPAILPGFAIRRVRNADYPGIVRCESSDTPVAGRVYFDLSDAVIRRLDAYEDGFYKRSEIFPVLEDASRVEAQAYLVPEETASTFLSDETWSLDWFETHGLQRFWERVFG